MKPIQLMSRDIARQIRWVLTDIDDTMTKDGKLVCEAYAALCELHDAGFRVIAVTGRSAGWGEVHLQEWPIDAAITENGAVSFFRPDGHSADRASGVLAHPSAARNTDPALVRAAEAAYRAVPRALPARDNRLRLYDYAIDHAEYVSPPLTGAEINEIIGIFEREGCVAKPSSIHINCWIGTFNKKEASLMLLREREGYNDATDRSKVLYIGDALNDEVMFEYFPNACAVANIDIWLDRLTHKPSWVSSERFGAGFAEICRHVLDSRT
jgi:HAD superfamily hydrolase (TIGR01484 family)